MEKTGESAGSTGRRAGLSDAKRAAFIARMTAGATHEFRNVLAVVKESAGLAQDLLAAGGAGEADRDRILRALARIEAQVARGADLSTSLNRVVHGLDRAEEYQDVEAALEHAVRLSGRAARQRGRRLEWIPSGAGLREGSAPGGWPGVRVNALDLYLGLVEALEWSLERVGEGGVLEVEVEWRSGRPALRFGARPEVVVGAEDAAGVGAVELPESLALLPLRVEHPVPGPLLLLFE